MTAAFLVFIVLAGAFILKGRMPKKEIDYSSKIEEWSSNDNEEIMAMYENEPRKFVSCQGTVGYEVSIVDGEIVFIDFKQYCDETDYLFAKQLHDIKDEGQNVKLMYSDGGDLLIVYNNGKVKCINTYSFFDKEGLPTDLSSKGKRVDKYYPKKSEVEKWSDISKVACDYSYVYGLKENGEMVNILYDTYYKEHDPPVENWDDLDSNDTAEYKYLFP